jgi:hypothetical protein
MTKTVCTGAGRGQLTLHRWVSYAVPKNSRNVHQIGNTVCFALSSVISTFLTEVELLSLLQFTEHSNLKNLVNYDSVL